MFSLAAILINRITEKNKPINSKSPIVIPAAPTVLKESLNLSNNVSWQETVVPNDSTHVTFDFSIIGTE